MSSLVISPPIVGIFNSLTPRPPTPPREPNRGLEYPLAAKLYGTRHASHPGQTLQTPPGIQSPTPSTAAGSGESLSRTRKKVGWAAQSETIAAGQQSRHPGAVAAAHYLSSPTSASSKPIRGILKPVSSTSPLAVSWGIHPDASLSSSNMVEMLDSTIRQLAGQDRDMKLDAYMLLTRALKASDNLPDRVALKDKMSLFAHFIQRDVCAKFEGDVSDTSLANHALNFLSTVLQLSAIASTLTSDFGRFILDHAVRLLEEPTIQKDLARSLMKVIVVQNFPAKVVTSDRVGRLLDALPKMDDHLSGKSITLSRIYIYKRLLRQCPSCLLNHPHWLKAVFTDMLSTVKDIQAQAVILGTEAGWALRSNKMLLRRVAELLRASRDGETYVEFYIKRLQALLGERSTASIVPQIWSAVILYLKCPLAHWQYYKPWFNLIQTALNARDMPTKLAAHLAWNRYVQLSLVDSNLSSKSLDTLCRPYLNQLRRKIVSNKHDEAPRLQEAVFGGICNLFYHALARNDDENAPDVLWDVAIQPIITQLLPVSGSKNDIGDGMTRAARILAGLLDSTTPRPSLAPQRLMDPAFLKPEELRPINARWLRRNCDKAFENVGPILQHNFLQLADDGSSTIRLWQALVSSASVASAKEVKVSEDTMRFLACSLNLLSRIWKTGITNERATKSIDVFLKCAEQFIEHLVEGLSSIPFTERQLHENASGVFEPVSASLARPDEGSLQFGRSRTPLQHLFCLLCIAPLGYEDDGKTCDLLTTVFHSLLGGKGKHRVEATWDLLKLLPEDGLTRFGPWLFAASSLQPEPSDGSALPAELPTDQGSPFTLVWHAGRLLESGLQSANMPFKHWTVLYEGLSTKVSRQLGDAFHTLLVIKPLAKCLLDIIEGHSEGVSLKALQAVETIFRDVKYGYDPEQMKNARLEVFGPPSDATLENSESPLVDLCKLGNYIMRHFHETSPTSYSTSTIASVLSGISNLLLCSFGRPFTETLLALQPGLCLCLQDKDIQAVTELGVNNSKVSDTLDTIWEPICRLFSTASMPIEGDIARLKPLLKAAKESKHVSIATSATSIWEAIFADEQPVPTPSEDELLPDSTQHEAEHIDATLLEGEGWMPTCTEKTRNLDWRLPNTLPSTSSPSKIKKSSKSKTTASFSVESKRGPSKEAHRRASKIPRLRHDDSQIHFESIVPWLPPQEESQHLTDHQEVRERQRESAVLYPLTQSSSPTGARVSTGPVREQLCPRVELQDPCPDMLRL